MIIINFNTSYGTRNLGDFIIVESVKKEMDFLFRNNFIYELPTHTPTITTLQNIDSAVKYECNKAELKFIDGTNIIKKSLFNLHPDWNISLLNKNPYKGAILVGAGMDGNFSRVDCYTRFIYAKILSKKYVHSTRDEKTKRFLESIGLQAMNTGCPTMWSLTDEHCKKIPKNKAKNVVFTLTDYRKDYEKDLELIKILKKNYAKLYFFAQGSDDENYLNEILDSNDIEVLHSLEAYREVLSRGNVDHVGTRLHAGIFALQNRVRSVIIIVDNRARDMKETYNIPSIERNKINSLNKLINSSIETRINIDTKCINKWKSQFTKFI